MAIKIITDSACDITRAMEQQYGVEIIPLQVNIEGQVYRDREDITPDVVYEKMKSGSVPKTSLVLSDKLADAFTKYAQSGDEVIYISFTSALSGSHNLAVLTAEDVCAEYSDFKIEIIDSKCASFGQGMVVLFAMKALEEGATYDELVSKIRDWSDNMEHIFTVDSLEYLYRGGRISRTTKTVGGLLGIKPILHVDDEGRLVSIEKSRGQKKTLSRMVEMMGELNPDIANETVGIIHADSPDVAEEVRNMVIEKYGCKDILMSELGAVIGAHAGPGTIAIFFLS
ncbi:MAG: DegV family protein [Clostridia bacterium]|nr:DegV family protein [Clostridia bacterium]